MLDATNPLCRSSNSPLRVLNSKFRQNVFCPFSIDTIQNHRIDKVIYCKTTQHRKQKSLLTYNKINKLRKIICLNGGKAINSRIYQCLLRLASPHLGLITPTLAQQNKSLIDTQLRLKD